MDFVFVQVDSALAPGYAEDPLVEGFRVTLKRSDLATLSNLNWLNDEVYTVCAAVMCVLKGRLLGDCALFLVKSDVSNFITKYLCSYKRWV